MDQWKTDIDCYMKAAEDLYASMLAHGYDPKYPVPVGSDGEILGGAHRLACAIALGKTEVPRLNHSYPAWAPPWGREWFIEHGLHITKVRELEAELEEMKNPVAGKH